MYPLSDSQLASAIRSAEADVEWFATHGDMQEYIDAREWLATLMRDRLSR